jgi:hypothetical protein
MNNMNTKSILSRADEIILLVVFKLKDNTYGVTIREQFFLDINKYWSYMAEGGLT